MDRDNLKPIHKSFYTGNMDAYHEDACCGGCIGEKEEGYSGGGMYCCCYEGLTPLEQWGNPAANPPIDGQLPEVFYKFGPRTQERYIKRFKNNLLYTIIFTDYGTISLPKETPPKYVFKRVSNRIAREVPYKETE